MVRKLRPEFPICKNSIDTLPTKPCTVTIIKWVKFNHIPTNNVTIKPCFHLYLYVYVCVSI